MKTDRTVTRDFLNRQNLPVEDSHRYAVSWLSADRQAEMWMGLGSTTEEALADAMREAVQSELAGTECYFVTWKIVD